MDLIQAGADKGGANLEDLWPRWRRGFDQPVIAKDSEAPMESRFRKLVRTKCASMMESPGRVLLSSESTIRKGTALWIGWNPGGSSQETIGKALELDDPWITAAPSHSCRTETLMKRAFAEFAKCVGIQPNHLCATNLCFVRTHAAKDVEKDEMEACWPIVVWLFSTVDPEIIVCNGVGTGRRLVKKAQEVEKRSCMPSGHSDWKVLYWRATIAGRSRHIIGIPHMSRYDLAGHKAVLCQIEKWTKA